jgi:hypothetical protein
MSSIPFRFAPRFARRGLILLGVVVALVGPAGVDTTVRLSPEEVATIREARLRKLHLVRPDLINYPIASDMLC